MNKNASNEASVITIPNIGSHLRLSWGGNSEIAIYHDSNEKNSNSNFNCVLTAQWYNKMTLGCLRKLTIQSYHIFETIQESKDDDIEIFLLKSREYRAVLNDCEDKLTSYISDLETQNDNNSEDYVLANVNCNMIKDYQMLWHLVEILFMKPISIAGNLVQELLNWFCIQIPTISIKYAEFLHHTQITHGDDNIENDKAYWSVIIGLGLQGKQQDLYTLLGYHSCANGSAIRTFRELIQKMPTAYMDSNLNYNSEKDIKRNWLVWKSQLKSQLMDTNLLLPYHELNLLLRIMMGDDLSVYAEDAVMELTEGCWYFALIPYLFYSYSSIGLRELSQTQLDFKRKHRMITKNIQDNEDSILTTSLSALFELDLGQFIAIISRSSSSYSGWLLAHLVDLLQRTNPSLLVSSKPHCSNLVKSKIFTPEYIETEIPHCREFFITEYALGLVNGPGMLLIALNYCLFCPMMGKQFIESCIDTTKFRTDKLADQMYSWCITNKLSHIAHTLAYTKCVEHFKRGCYGNSIYWCRKCDNDRRVPFLNRIASLLLEKMLNNHQESMQNSLEDSAVDNWDCKAVEDLLGTLSDEDLDVKKMLFLQKMFQIKKNIRNAISNGLRSYEDSNDSLEESLSPNKSVRDSQLKVAMELLRDLCSSKLVCNEMMAICIDDLLPGLLLRDGSNSLSNYRGVFDLATLQELLECIYLSNNDTLKGNKQSLIKLLLGELANVSIRL